MRLGTNWSLCSKPAASSPEMPTGPTHACCASRTGFRGPAPVSAGPIARRSSIVGRTPSSRCARKPAFPNIVRVLVKSPPTIMSWARVCTAAPAPSETSRPGCPPHSILERAFANAVEKLSALAHRHHVGRSRRPAGRRREHFCEGHPGHPAQQLRRPRSKSSLSRLLPRKGRCESVRAAQVIPTSFNTTSRRCRARPQVRPGALYFHSIRLLQLVECNSTRRCFPSRHHGRAGERT